MACLPWLIYSAQYKSPDYNTCVVLFKAKWGLNCKKLLKELERWPLWYHEHPQGTTSSCKSKVASHESIIIPRDEGLLMDSGFAIKIRLQWHQVGNLYLDQPLRSEGDGSHQKSLSGSAMEIRVQWHPWEILTAPIMVWIQ